MTLFHTCCVILFVIGLNFNLHFTGLGKWEPFGSFIKSTCFLVQSTRGKPETKAVSSSNEAETRREAIQSEQGNFAQCLHEHLREEGQIGSRTLSPDIKFVDG